MYISKKELLQKTSISYGQLYRWKREGLIPEKWFIKQSSFTGQETVFPKENILKRINAIQALKDKYSLEELAGILSPEVTERLFTRSDLQMIEELNQNLSPVICLCLAKESFRYIELLIMIAVSQCHEKRNLSENDIKNLCFGIKNRLDDVKHTDYLFILLHTNGIYYAAIQNEQAEMIFDERLEIVYQVHLNEISAAIKLKYRKRFNFQFESADYDSPASKGDKKGW